VEAQAHQELPFEKLVEELAPSRGLSRIPVAQVLFSMVSDLNYGTLNLPGADVTDFSRPATAVRFELELHLLDRGADLAGELIYATDLFDATTVELFAEHYVRFLAGVCRDPEQRVSQVPITTAEELGLFEQWNNSDSPE
jgi:non-ribosomal peptide synthetase component F